jgi:hypothetical protein
MSLSRVRHTAAVVALILTPLALVGLAGCEAPNRVQAFAGFAPDAADKNALRESLFPGDQAVMSNDALRQVLDSRIVMPKQARVAVVRVGKQRWGCWSEDLVRLDESNVQRFLDTLRACPRIASAAVVPSILTPPRITVPLLREAAARTQSDAVLLYQATSYSYGRTRAFAPDETRAYCVVEAFLLDTRTGVIPFTSVKTETYCATKSRADMDFAETIQKCEMAAADKALQRIADEFVKFMAGLPVAER